MLIFVASCADNQRDKEIASYKEDYQFAENEDATLRFYHVLQQVKNNGDTLLSIPKGTYHFYLDKAFEKYCAVSNNDNSKKRIAFPLIGFQNLTIDMQGSELIFHGMITPFVIEESKNIKLKNFNIDYAEPFHGQAEVVKVNETDRTFDVKIGGEWTYELHDKNLYFSSARGLINIQKNIFFNPYSRATVYNVGNYKIDPWNKWVNDAYYAEEIDTGIVRIHVGECTWPKNPDMPEVGWIWVCKGGHGSRLVPGICVFNTDSLLFENINIYHSGAMGLIAERSSDITMENFNVKLREGSKRMVSSTADATHFVNCKGNVVFNNCTFENMLDDATNVHGIYAKLADVVDEMTIGVKRIHSQQTGFQFATPGDTLLISDPKTLLPYKTMVVAEVQDMNEEYMLLTFTESLGENLVPNSGVENISWSAGMKMTNCTVRQNRARSILISTRGKVLVEDNYFSSMMAAIRISGDMNFWFESGPVEDVTIRNNTFVDLCSGGKGNVVLMLDPVIKDISKVIGYYHKNITIENNMIKTFDKGIVYAKSIENLVFKNNIIEQTNTFLPLNPEKPTIEIIGCKNVNISGNTYNGKADANIVVDDFSEEVVLGGNKGMRKED